MRRILYVALVVAALALGIAAAELTLALAGRGAGLLMALLPGLIGTVLWVSQGGSMKSALSWTVPITALLVVAALLPDGNVAVWALTAVALSLLLAMLFVESARRRWLDLVRLTFADAGGPDRRG